MTMAQRARKRQPRRPAAARAGRAAGRYSIWRVAASVLLGFQVGGIIGHKFLGGYKVSMDMAASELRLEKY